MDIDQALRVSAQGLQVQTTRLRVIAENLANQDTTGSTAGRRAVSPQDGHVRRPDRHRDGRGRRQRRPRRRRRVRVPETLRPVAPRRRFHRLREAAQRQQLRRGGGHARGPAQLQRQSRRAADDARHPAAHHRAAEIAARRRMADASRHDRDAAAGRQRLSPGRAAARRRRDLRRDRGSPISAPCSASALQGVVASGDAAEAQRCRRCPAAAT